MPTTTKVFKVKSGTIKAGVKGGDYAELIEEREGKEIKHRIFKSVQRVDGSWVSLKEDLEILIEKIGNNEIEGMLIGLDKEQDKDKKYWNVIAVDFDPPDEPEAKEPQAPKPQTKTYAKSPQRKEAFAPSPEKIESIEGQKAADITAQLFIASKLELLAKSDNPVAHLLYQWLKEKLSVNLLTKGMTVEVAITPKEPEPPKTISVGDIKEVAYNQCGWSFDNLKEYCQKKKWQNLSDLTQDQRAELIKHIKANPRK
jgi:hypothetical protein